MADPTREHWVSPTLCLCTDVAWGEYLVVTSENFRVTCGGYAQQLGDGWMQVRLELDDDHPAVQDAKGDNPDRETDYFEFIDVVPLAALGRPDGRRIRSWTRGPTDAEMAARARARGFERLVLPELDRGLRTRR